MARHLGTEHTELYVSSDEAMAVIPSLPRIYDEPFADCSQIPTILVSQLAREHVTVSLSGDGGDELFGGYNRHVWADTLNRHIDHLPLILRKFGASGIRTMPPDGWDFLFRVCNPATPVRLQMRMPGYKLHKLASLWKVRTCMLSTRGWYLTGWIRRRFFRKFSSPQHSSPESIINALDTLPRT